MAEKKTSKLLWVAGLVVGVCLVLFVAWMVTSTSSKSDLKEEAASQSVAVAQQQVFAPNPILEELDKNMVFVEGGVYAMGENGAGALQNEKPIHFVTISNFSINKYEVTQAQWEAVMGSNPSYFKGENLPVEKVSWENVQEFITKLNAQTGKQYRLPTEAEWEFAALGGVKCHDYKYSGSNNVDGVAWIFTNSGSRTHAVGTKSPNELGIYDMSGNVLEWCSDWYGATYYSTSPQNNPQGPETGASRILRGGSWGGEVKHARVSQRYAAAPTALGNSIGFRLCRDV